MQKLKPVKLIAANALKEMAAVTAKIADTVNETEEIVGSPEKLAERINQA